MAGNDSYTKLLIHSDSTDGSTVFEDSSDSAHAITVVDNVHHEIDQAKFGNTSIEFDGTNDCLAIATSDDFDFGEDDFTVDLWCNISVFDNDGIFSLTQDNTFKLTLHASISGGNFLKIRVDGESATEVKILAIDTFYHVAVIRYGDSLSVYIDGISEYSQDVSGISFSDNDTGIWIGTYADAVHNYDGYLDEIRISKGIARWTTNFTPPTASYSLVLNVSETYYSQESDNITLATLYELEVNEANHIQWLDNLYIGPVVKSSTHLQFAEDPFGVKPNLVYHEQVTESALSIPVILEDAEHTQIATDPFSLKLNSSTHLQISDDPGLVVDLDIDNPFHMQTAHTIWSTGQNETLIPSDNILYQVTESLVITQEGNNVDVVPEDTYSLHVVDNLILTDPDSLIVSETYHEQNADENLALAYIPFPTVETELRIASFEMEARFSGQVDLTLEALDLESTGHISIVSSAELTLGTFSLIGQITKSSIANVGLNLPSFDFKGSIDVYIVLEGSLELESLLLDSDLNPGITITCEQLLSNLELDAYINKETDALILTHNSDSDNWAVI